MILLGFLRRCFWSSIPQWFNHLTWLSLLMAFDDFTLPPPPSGSPWHHLWNLASHLCFQSRFLLALHCDYRESGKNKIKTLSMSVNLSFSHSRFLSTKSYLFSFHPLLPLTSYIHFKDNRSTGTKRPYEGHLNLIFDTAISPSLSSSPLSSPDFSASNVLSSQETPDAASSSLTPPTPSPPHQLF